MQIKDINSGVLQACWDRCSICYTADLPIALSTTTATYADGTAILVAHNKYIEASQRLQESLS